MDQMKASGLSAEILERLEVARVKPERVEPLPWGGMRRFLCMTTAIASFLPPSGRMLVFRDAQGIVRDPYGRKYVAGGV